MFSFPRANGAGHGEQQAKPRVCAWKIRSGCSVWSYGLRRIDAGLSSGSAVPPGPAPGRGRSKGLRGGRTAAAGPDRSVRASIHLKRAWRQPKRQAGPNRRRSLSAQCRPRYQGTSAGCGPDAGDSAAGRSGRRSLGSAQVGTVVTGKSLRPRCLTRSVEGKLVAGERYSLTRHVSTYRFLGP
jgi:hypothetical protein